MWIGSWVKQADYHELIHGRYAKKMNRRICLLLCTIFLLTACGPASPDPAATPIPPAMPTAVPVPDLPETAVLFTLDPAASEVGYEITEEFFAGADYLLGRIPGVLQTVGATSEMSGRLALDFAAEPPSFIWGYFQADISTLRSNYAHRDQMLRTRWLESKRYPAAVFEATAVEKWPTDYTEGEPVTFDLLGDLTIRGVTRPTRFAVTAVLADGQIAGEATAAVRMTDFGFDPPQIIDTVTVEDRFLVTVELVLTAEE